MITEDKKTSKKDTHHSHADIHTQTLSLHLSVKTPHFSSGIPSLCTSLFSPTVMSSLQQPHCTFCAHSANFSTHTHTHLCTQTHTQIFNSPAAANRWRQASGWRKIVWVVWKWRAKTHVCLDSIQMCYMFSEYTLQPEGMNPVHY